MQKKIHERKTTPKATSSNCSQAWRCCLSISHTQPARLLALFGAPNSSFYTQRLKVDLRFHNTTHSRRRHSRQSAAGSRFSLLLLLGFWRLSLIVLFLFSLHCFLFVFLLPMFGCCVCKSISLFAGWHLYVCHPMLSLFAYALALSLLSLFQLYGIINAFQPPPTPPPAPRSDFPSLLFSHSFVRSFV